VEEKGVGIGLSSFRGQIVDAVRRMTDDCRRTEFVRNVEAIRNRAVFEVPDILAGILG
jgi:hypothetical protein